MSCVGLDDNLMGEAEASGLFAPHGVDTDGLDLPEAWTEQGCSSPMTGAISPSSMIPTSSRPPPSSLKQLVEDKNGPKVVIEDPRTSTPGLGLLAWMQAVYGDKAPDAWKRCKPRIVTVTKGWSEAYGLFLKGEADMVLSYSTSPAYHIGAEKKTNYKAAMFSEGHATSGRGRRSRRDVNTGRSRPALPRLPAVGATARRCCRRPTGCIPPGRPPQACPRASRPFDCRQGTDVGPRRLAENRRAWIDEWLGPGEVSE